MCGVSDDDGFGAGGAVLDVWEWSGDKWDGGTDVGGGEDGVGRERLGGVEYIFFLYRNWGFFFS